MRPSLKAIKVFSLVSAFLYTNAAIANDFPGVERLMSPKEYKEAGLDKLSEAEIQKLNSWLIKYTANDALVISKTVKSVKEESNAEIHSHIVGTFTGWNGSTVFKLDNGQVWKQRKLAIKRKWKTNLNNPKVIISKNLLGYYQLTIVEADKTTKVKRIR